MSANSNEGDALRHYESNADTLLIEYEKVTFEQVHKDLLPFLETPGLALDVGSGSGRDAAYLAALGWTVVAAEPSQSLLRGARHLHRNERICWIQDRLPGLNHVAALNLSYDLVILSAIWIHLNSTEEAHATDTIAELCSNSALVSVTLKCGPNEPRRGFFQKDPTSVIELFSSRGMRLISLNLNDDLFGRAHITWHSLIFERM
jgi:SAM-dependent methyltransferase